MPLKPDAAKPNPHQTATIIVRTEEKENIRIAIRDDALAAYLEEQLPVYSTNDNLFLRSGPEIIGSVVLNKAFLNPKHEIRKTKQYRMTKNKMIQTKDIPGIAI